MEGLRRAYLLPRGALGFWHERAIALALVPGTLVPMLFATFIVAFGHNIEHWMIDNSDHQLQSYVLLLWRIIRWSIAVLTSITVIAVIYHFGVPHQRSWRCVLPGAVLATVTWFLVTLLYGWYVTRFADYSVVYGSLGAGVATLVWLYMVCLSILIGGEFNAQIFPIVDSVSANGDERSVTFHNPQTA
jgi:membrane protein